jgi:hypothetical protein
MSGIAIGLQLANPYRQNSAPSPEFPHKEINFLIDMFVFLILDGLIGEGIFTIGR